MAEHLWTVLCTRAVVDKDTNQVSLLEVVEALEVGFQEPITFTPDTRVLVPFHSELVSLWTRTDASVPETFICLLEVLAPDGTRLAEHSLEVNLTEKTRYRSIFRSDAFPLAAGGGTYRFNLSLGRDGKLERVASIPLDVKVVGATQEEKKKKPKRPRNA